MKIHKVVISKRNDLIIVMVTFIRGGNLSYRNFEILSRCQSKLEAEVREAFLVTKYKPTMNSQLFMSGASLTLKIFG